METGDRIGLAVVEGVPDRMPERAAVLLLQINHSFIHSFILCWHGAQHLPVDTYLVVCGHI